MEEGMAAGGIVAFADGGDIDPLSMITGNVGPEALAIDEARRQAVLAKRKEAEDAERLEFLKTAAPEVAARLERERKAATPSAPKPAATQLPPAPAVEEAPKKVPPKARTEVTKAAQDVAKAAGVPEKSMADEAMDLYRQMQGLRKTDIDRLNAIIEGQKGRAQEIKGRGLADALMNFGFTMAAKASKPGATFLGSASEAAPAIATTLAENRKAVQAAQENYDKLRADQAKYQIALDTGDVRTAMTTARDIAKDRMDQKRLDQLIAYQNRALNIQAAQAANRQPAISQLAEEIMADPSFKGSKMDALNAASGLIGGVGMRTDFNRQKLLADKLEKDTSLKLLNLQLNAAKTDADRADIQSKINARKAAIMQDVNVQTGGGGTAPTTVQRYDAKGNLIQ
jgi:hypothetical protein